MKLDTEMKDTQDIVNTCLKCTACAYSGWPEEYHTVCPLFIYENTFKGSLGGLVYTIRGLLEGDLKYDKTIAEYAFSDPLCNACNASCYVLSIHREDIKPADFIRLLRAELVKQGMIPEGKVKEIFSQIQAKGTVVSQPQPAVTLPDQVLDVNSSRVLFAECFHTPAQKEIFQSLAKVLQKAGARVALFSESDCCGSTLYDLGFWDQLKPVANQNWAKMKSMSHQEFIFLNPHCQEFISKRYAEFVPDYKAIRHSHVSQFLADALKNNKIKSTRTSRVKVSYHDPCYLGRGLGIFDPPRSALSALPGVELVEMKRNKQNSLCCGARSMTDYFPDLNQATAKERIREFEATGAELLITACPYCKDNFQKALPANDSGRIKDLVEFINERTT